MKRIILFLSLLIMVGCCSPFEDSSKDILIAYTVRQNAINEQRVREQEKKDAVKQIQLQAIRGGFAYWDVDENGDVTFKWVGQRKH